MRLVSKPDPLYLQFGKLIRSHRIRHNLTQSAIAERIGLKRTSVTNIEKGRQKILLHQLFQLADALKVNPEHLLPSVARQENARMIEDKLPEGLREPEKDWVHRVVGSTAQRGVNDEKGKQK